MILHFSCCLPLRPCRADPSADSYVHSVELERSSVAPFRSEGHMFGDTSSVSSGLTRRPHGLATACGPSEDRTRTSFPVFAPVERRRRL